MFQGIFFNVQNVPMVVKSWKLDVDDYGCRWSDYSYAGEQCHPVRLHIIILILTLTNLLTRHSWYSSLLRESSLGFLFLKNSGMASTAAPAALWLFLLQRRPPTTTSPRVPSQAGPAAWTALTGKFTNIYILKSHFSDLFHFISFIQLKQSN